MTPRSTAPSEIREVWRRIETWLTAHAPEFAANLAPPCAADALDQLRRITGVSLPPDAAESYGVHDGERGPPVGPLMGDWHLMSIGEIQSQWTMLEEVARSGAFADAEGEPDPGIVADWWNAGWLPIAHNDAGDYRCIDLAPTASGTVGQIIAYNHVDARRQLLASSFTAWLAAFATDLESERYRAENGWLVSVRKGEKANDGEHNAL